MAIKLVQMTAKNKKQSALRYARCFFYMLIVAVTLLIIAVISLEQFYDFVSQKFDSSPV